VALAGSDQAPGQALKRRGKQDRLLAEVKQYPVIAGVDIIEGPHQFHGSGWQLEGRVPRPRYAQ
jgi:hypothetical protein